MSMLKESQWNSLYNDRPVYYCSSCLSLAIQIIGNPEDNDSLCMYCNRTDIKQAHIKEWREMWKNKYGKYPEE